MFRARNAHGPEQRGEGVGEAAKLLGFSKKPLLGLRDLRDARIQSSPNCLEFEGYKGR